MQWLIGIDWGTSSLRATLFDADGMVRDARTRPWGIRHLPGGGFDAALADICGDWPPCPVLAAGMVGSRQGWREVAYVDAPTDIRAVAAGLATLQSANSRQLSIVPGVRDSVAPDVMRGEETQVFGALDASPQLAGRGQLVLPGTHSKWVDVRDGRIVHFSTMMTGEIYGVLRAHSILGATVPASAMPGSHPQAFDDGVQVARNCGSVGVLSRLFSTRVRMLESQLQPSAMPDYLSGLLIGEEWRAMIASGWLGADRVPTLVGDDALCARYARAATLFDLPQPESIADASMRGLLRIAGMAKLIAGHAGTAVPQEPH